MAEVLWAHHTIVWRKTKESLFSLSTTISNITCLSQTTISNITCLSQTVLKSILQTQAYCRKKIHPFFHVSCLKKHLVPHVLRIALPKVIDDGLVEKTLLAVFGRRMLQVYNCWYDGLYKMKVMQLRRIMMTSLPSFLISIFKILRTKLFFKGE